MLKDVSFKTMLKTVIAICIICAIVSVLDPANAKSNETKDYTSIYYDENGQDVTKFCDMKDLKVINQTPENKDDQKRPSYSELIEFKNSITVKEGKNYPDVMFKASKNEHPFWPCDEWQDSTGKKMISWYYQKGTESGLIDSQKKTDCPCKDQKGDCVDCASKNCVTGNCGNKVTDDPINEKVTDNSKRDYIKPETETESVNEYQDRELKLDSDTFSMSNKEKIESIVKFAKSEGFNDSEIKDLETWLPHYWGY